MPKLKNVGVREFPHHATTYLSGSDLVAVSKQPGDRGLHHRRS